MGVEFQSGVNVLQHLLNAANVALLLTDGSKKLLIEDFQFSCHSDLQIKTHLTLTVVPSYSGTSTSLHKPNHPRNADCEPHRFPGDGDCRYVLDEVRFNIPESMTRLVLRVGGLALWRRGPLQSGRRS